MQHTLFQLIYFLWQVHILACENFKLDGEIFSFSGFNTTWLRREEGFLLGKHCFLICVLPLQTNYRSYKKGHRVSSLVSLVNNSDQTAHFGFSPGFVFFFVLRKFANLPKTKNKPNTKTHTHTHTQPHT